MNTGKLERWTRRKLIRMLAFDERRELRQLRADGLLDLPATDAGLLQRPLTPGELHEIRDGALTSSRFFFYRIDPPLRPPDINEYGLNSIPYWDRIFTNLERPFELHWLIKLLHARTAIGGSCLEIGCGTKFPSPYLLARHYQKVTAIDLKPAILENERWPNVEFAIVDAAQLPYDDASFDDVYSVSAIEHVNLGAAVNVFREVHRVLRAGGRVISTLGIGEERKSWPGRYNPDDVYGSRDVPFWVALLQNLGFLVELDPHGQGQYNDGERLHRVCIDRRSRIRGFATYRIVAEKRP